MPDLASTAIGGGIALIDTVTNLVNKKKTKEEARELQRTRPKYQENQLIADDLSLAESEAASGGISARAERAYNNLNDKQFSSSLGAILRGGGSVNNVADVFGENEEGRQRLALISDQARLNQISNLSRARQNQVNEDNKAFEFNEWNPWADRAQANAQARQGAENGVWRGLDNLAGAGMQYFGQKYNENQYDKYFNRGNQTPTSNRGQLDFSFYKPQPPQDVNPYDAPKLDLSWYNPQAPQDVNPFG